ncbi:dTMP kinase [Thermoactinomyces sp. DSM 45892]|uniref:dTMP kinase n=1 Tax=Thermoactinomyces sp. DSM 45892 TaxID=1882753 RepID=UPI0008984E9E|nr:dTMP kinase [Thermoactinomyces sp. DSM 45892]SDY95765.1 dTMP kinase [Thermoactinomyces sp. DSM 45892]
MDGLFISFEGPEGAGKTTQIRRICEWLDHQGISYIHVREPGGTRIGNEIRELVLHPEFDEMSMLTEVLLYASSRAQLVGEVIMPALAEGKMVLCDRYVDSSVAYQSYGAGVPLAVVLSINEQATSGLRPHRTYLLDIPPEVSESRVKARGGDVDRMEQRDSSFHRRVREGYLELSTRYPHRYRVIQGDRELEDINRQIKQDLLQLMSYGK